MADATASAPREDARSARFRDRVCGLLFGAAIGDALGVLTEFETRENAGVLVDFVEALPGGDGLRFDGWPRDRRCGPNVPEGDWTDDMDQHAMVVLSLLAHDGRPSPADFASRMRHWERHGFPEPPFNDTEAAGIGFGTSLAIGHPLFASGDAGHRGAAALHVWLHPLFRDSATGKARHGSANGAVMRTAILGALDEAPEAALAYSRTTHASPHADATAVAVAEAVRALLGGDEPEAAAARAVDAAVEQFEESVRTLPTRISALLETLATPPTGLLDPNGFFEPGSHEGLAEAWEVPADGSAEELRADLSKSSLEELALAEKEIGSAAKTAGTGLWALRAGLGGSGGGTEGFRAVVTSLTREGGDADTNATVAGALMGAAVGFDELPKCWVDGLLHRDWLHRQASKLCDVLLKSRNSAASRDRTSDEEQLAKNGVASPDWTSEQQQFAEAAAMVASPDQTGDEQRQLEKSEVASPDLTGEQQQQQQQHQQDQHTKSEDVSPDETGDEQRHATKSEASSPDLTGEQQHQHQQQHTKSEDVSPGKTGDEQRHATKSEAACPDLTDDEKWQHAKSERAAASPGQTDERQQHGEGAV